MPNDDRYPARHTPFAPAPAPTAEAVLRWLRMPTAEDADRWLRGRGTPLPRPPHAATAALTARQRRAVRRAPDVRSGLPGSVPVGERWRHVLGRPEGERRAEAGVRTPQPLTIALATPGTTPLRLRYHVVVVDGEVALLPRTVAVPGLIARVIGAREPYAPAGVLPLGEAPPRPRSAEHARRQTATIARHRRWRAARSLATPPAPGTSAPPDPDLVYRVVWETAQTLQAVYDGLPRQGGRLP